MSDPDTAKLLLRMKRTKSNRFNYAARLSAKANVKSFVLNLITLVSIAISIYLLSYADQLSADSNRLIGAIVAGISVAALIMSLQDPVSELSRRSSEAHRCAREISNLYGKLQHGAIDKASARSEYESILNGYENHDEVDNNKTLYERKSDFPEDSSGVYWLKDVLPYHASKYSPAFSAAFLVAFVVAVGAAMVMVETYTRTSHGVSADNAPGMQK